MRRNQEEMCSYIDEWKQSGLSRKAFCRKRGIAPSTFSYWYTKYTPSDSGQGGDFVEVNPILSESIEVIYPNGVKIRMPQKSSLSALQALINLI